MEIPGNESKQQRDRLELKQAITLIAVTIAPLLVGYYSTVVAYTGKSGQLNMFPTLSNDPILTYSGIVAFCFSLLIPILLVCWPNGIGIRKIVRQLSSRPADRRWLVALLPAVSAVAISLIEYKRNIFGISYPAEPMPRSMFFYFWTATVFGALKSLCFWLALASISNPKNRLLLILTGMFAQPMVQEAVGLYLHLRYPAANSPIYVVVFPQPLPLEGWLGLFLYFGFLISFAEVFRPTLLPMTIYITLNSLVDTFCWRFGGSYHYVWFVAEALTIAAIWSLRTEGSLAFRENWLGAIRSVRDRATAWSAAPE